MEIFRRYPSIELPTEFYDVRLCWMDTFPLSQPLNLRHPSRIQVADPVEDAPPTDEGITRDVRPEDVNCTFTAKVKDVTSLIMKTGLQQQSANIGSENWKLKVTLVFLSPNLSPATQ